MNLFGCVFVLVKSFDEEREDIVSVGNDHLARYCNTGYAINPTKKEFFDIEHTRIPHFNPLPILMAFPGYGDGCTGFWLGDQIEVSNESPPAEYKDKSAEYGRDT